MDQKFSYQERGKRQKGEPLLHVVTVHWRSDRWIDIQHGYFQRWITSPFRIYASLDEQPRKIQRKFWYQTELQGSHDEKLDQLAQMIIDDPETRDDDWLLFVDGDAFPVADVTAYGSEKLAQYPLVAVQRFENNEDIQPHPCFCMTTVAYWRDIKATWQPGFHWTNPQGQQITDIGGELLGILQERGDDWYLMLRSNCAKYHPVFFAVYDGLAYHHGAGFRKGCSRKAIKDMMEEMEGTFFFWFLGVIHRLMKPGFLKGLQYFFSHEFWAKKLAIQKSQRLSRRMYKRISEDHVFYLDL